MKSWYQQPNPSISEYVRTVLILEGFSQSDARELPIITNGMSALFCKTELHQEGNERIVQLMLFGKSIPEEIFTVNERTTIVTYFFKPFSMASVFDVPATTLVRDSVDLAEWSAHKTNALKTQLIYSKTTQRKIEVLNNLVSHQLDINRKQCELIRHATDEIMCNSAPEILTKLLMKLEVNERTFQRIFKKFVGVTPNQYRRICQFQLSFAQVRAQDFDKLADVAFDNGFSDQSHFIRSFKEFTQVTPNDYLRSGLKKKKS
jgi:AraC-like DNA-binding protein